MVMLVSSNLSKMCNIVFVFFILICVNLGSGETQGPVAFPDHRIVGGYPAIRSNFSYQVSLRSNKGRSHFCGGTIIDSKHVLTASHCVVSNGDVTPTKDIVVVAGDLYISQPNIATVTRKVQHIFAHPKYNNITLKNDVAVIRVTESFGNWTTDLNLIPLAISTPPANTSCVVSGWGVRHEDSTLISDYLQYVDIYMVNRNLCMSFYGAVNILPGMICAGYMPGGRDSCQGDSGGPLVCNNSLVGVVSWGNGCAKPNYPGIYAEVATYRSWITEQLTRSSSPNLVAGVSIVFAALTSAYTRTLI